MVGFTRFVLLSIPLLFFLGCASKSYLPKDAELEERLVGIWRGELQMENSDQLRRWKKKRRSDGSLVINIGLYDQDMTYLGREVHSGFWWVKGKQYFEKFPGMNHLVVPHDYEWTKEGLPKFTVYTRGSGQPHSFTEITVGEVE